MPDDAAILVEIDAIQQVYRTYCEIIDAKDYDRLSEVFTRDCLGDYRSSNGILQDGLAPLVARLHRNMGRHPLADCGATHHNVCNFRIALTGGTAEGQLTPRAAAAHLVHALASEGGGTVQVSEPDAEVLLFGAALKGGVTSA